MNHFAQNNFCHHKFIHTVNKVNLLGPIFFLSWCIKKNVLVIFRHILFFFTQSVSNIRVQFYFIYFFSLIFLFIREINIIVY